MKVYVVEVGAYSDRYIDIVFTTRELAERYIDERIRKQYEVDLRRWEETPEQFRRGIGKASYEEYREKRGNLWTNEFGSVEEYEVWDVIPIYDPETQDLVAK